MQISMKANYQTKIYVTVGGYVRIEQDIEYSTDNFVLLSPSQLKVLQSNIDDLLCDAEELFNADDEVDDE